MKNSKQKVKSSSASKSIAKPLDSGSMGKKKRIFPIHKIRSFDDLMDVLNDDNCDMIFGNFYGCVKAFLEVRKKHPDLKMSGFDWIDDGKIELKETNVTVNQRFKIALKDAEK